jgi:hypothetical protein
MKIKKSNGESGILEKSVLGKPISFTRIMNCDGSGFENLRPGEKVRLCKPDENFKYSFLRDIGSGPEYSVNNIYSNRGRITLEVQGDNGKGYYNLSKFNKSK